MGDSSTPEASSSVRPLGFLEVLRIRVFAVLFFAETQSLVGDQLARVALSVLVFDRTKSIVATAMTYAATMLPAVFGGVFAARIGDRLSRRLVLVVLDVVRAALFAAMAVPGIPLAVVIGLLVVAVFLGPAFTATEVSFLAAALTPDEFRVATGLRATASQIAQVAGFALGGLAVAALHPRGALALDAATFAVSAAVITVTLRARNASGTSRVATPDPAVDRDFRGFWRDRRLRALVVLMLLSGFFVAPEGLAVPYAERTGASTTEAGLLLAAIPLGGAVGALVVIRLVPVRARLPLAAGMAVCCGLPLLVTVVSPAWPVAWVCWFASGALAAYQVEVIPQIVQAVPDRLRAHHIGVLSAALTGVQGIGIVGFGAIADGLGVGHAVALAGLLGSALAVAGVPSLRKPAARMSAARLDQSTGEARPEARPEQIVYDPREVA